MQLLSRDDYYAHTQGKISKMCPFCHERQIVLHNGKEWTWIASIAPYVRYHTMLVPKRHVTKVSELTVSEWKEFNLLHDKISDAYQQKEVTWTDTDEEIENIIFAWRYRRRLKNKKLNTQNLDHLHLHIVPDRDHFLDPLSSD